jgi:predicted phage terminase large subunit-like protein
MSSSSQLPAEALKEYGRRRVRADLTEWCQLVGFTPSAHHQIIIRELEAVARGEVDRLALFLPPGSAKSTYASVLFPPWWLAQNPDRSIIAASHTENLAERFGRRVRNLIDVHADTLDISVASDNRSAGRWQLDQGAEYIAVGVGGGISGWRAGLAVIDDPVRNREDADSEAIREKTYEWYSFDIIPRLLPDAAIVLIQTRWHEDDLAGRILASEAGRWRVVSIPMECEATDDPLGRALGERLWPEWFTPQMVEEAKTDPRKWSALYQQRPAAAEGDYFRREWLHVTDDIPPASELRVYGGSDYAVTAGGGDYTVHAVMGVDAENRCYLLDIWRQQTASDVWIDAWCDLVKLWKPIAWGEESGQINASLGPFIERRQRELRAHVFREQFPSRFDKAIRAQAIRGLMATQGLWIPARAKWRKDLEAELFSFPVGKHDDQVDALSLIGQLLDQVLAPAKKVVSKIARIRDYRVVKPSTSPLTTAKII